MLASAAIERTSNAITDFVDCAREYGAEIRCIATSAVRRAQNVAEFRDHVRALTDAPLEVLSGSDEARLGFLGATSSRTGDERIGVIDIGGGSTECAVGRPQSFENAVSLEIGTVRMIERHPALVGNDGSPAARRAAQVAADEARSTLASVTSLRDVDLLLGVAGTPLTLGAIGWGSDVEKVRGKSLDRGMIGVTLDCLLACSLEERKALPGMIAERADVLAAGAILLDACCEAFGRDSLTLESDDLLLGAILEEASVKSA
jgi:exopolyphosphatase/guanosine-5'-triphosphate,3'-diphosphate pyrophosphatase